MNKTYRVKNYKGNFIESVKRFQEKYPDSKIISVCESNGELKIKAESLNRREEDELYFDVRDWCGDNFDKYSEKELKDLADDIDKNAEIFTKMLDDLKMQDADDEVKDRMHSILVDFADQEVN